MKIPFITWILGALVAIVFGVFIPISLKAAIGVFAIGCFVCRGHLRRPGVWQLAALCAYESIVTIAFSFSDVEAREIINEPAFHAGMLMIATGFVYAAEAEAILMAACGLLLLSLVGLAGDMRGIDMTRFIPLEMPDYELFDRLGMRADGSVRYRGFCPEASVLGGVVTSVAALGGLMAFMLWRRKKKSAYLLSCLAICGCGGAIVIATTQTKTSLVTLAAAALGCATAVCLHANSRVKAFSILGGSVAAAGLVGFVVSSDSVVADYLRTEILSLPDSAVVTSDARQQTGAMTRVAAWDCAVEAVRMYPTGVGRFGMDEVLHRSHDISLTPELEFWFQQGFYGLKNALANLLMRTGLPGVALLGMGLYALFIRPVRAVPGRSRRKLEVSMLYLAGLGISVAMMSSCELYPHLGFTVLLAGIARAGARRLGDEARSPAKTVHPLMQTQPLQMAPA